MNFTQGSDDSKGILVILVNLLFYAKIAHKKQGTRSVYKDEIRFR